MEAIDRSLRQYKYVIAIFIAIALLLLLYFIISRKDMQPHRRYRGVFFWAIDKEKMDSALLVRKNLDNRKLIAITKELLDAIRVIDSTKLKGDYYYVFEKSFQDAESYEETLDNIIEREQFFQDMISKLENNEDIEAVVPQIISTYQFYKAGAIFHEFWFNRPYVYFSKEFYEDYLPAHNSFIKKNNFYLAGDIYFKRFDKEVELLGDTVENLGYFMSQIPQEYAKKVIENKKEISEGNFSEEARLYYQVMEKIVNQKAEVFVIELD